MTNDDYLDGPERDNLIRGCTNGIRMSTATSPTTGAYVTQTSGNSSTFQTTCAPVNWPSQTTQSGMTWFGAASPPSPWPIPKSTFTIHGVELDLDEILKILKFKYTQEELEIMAMGLRLTRKEDDPLEHV